MTAVVEDLRAWPGLDSRGTPTVVCAARLDDGTVAEAIAPSGASTGRYEALELRDGGPSWGGRGVSRAVANVRDVLLPAVRGIPAADQAALDAALHAADPEGRFTRVGANAAVAVSLACFLAAAAAARVEPWEHAARLAGAEPVLPLPTVNIVSGGAHAAGRLDIQDVLVVPVGARDLPEAVAMAWEVRRAAGELAARTGLAPLLVADEGGVSPALPDNLAALRFVVEAAQAAGLTPGRDVALAVDVAAGELATPAGYRLAVEGRELDSTAMVAEVARWVAATPLVSVEDPLDDDDWAGWRAAAAALPGVQLLADDLVATDPDRVGPALAAGATAVLVKVNQAGTVSDALRVLSMTRAGDAAPVVSARSGDTEQSWLADLAVGWGAGQIKVGSTHRSERTAKWNRLLALAARHGTALPYAGAAALRYGTRERGTSTGATSTGRTHTGAADSGGTAVPGAGDRPGEGCGQ